MTSFYSRLTNALSARQHAYIPNSFSMFRSILFTLALSLVATPAFAESGAPTDQHDAKHDAKHDNNKVDAMHHVSDGNTLEFEPFGEIHLPHLSLFGLDISITRHVVFMWLGCLILMVIATLAARGYKNKNEAPSGITNLVEVMVDFVRSDIVKPMIGHGYEPFLPYLLTAFFFILTCNLLGLIPYSATATSSIGVTLTLALFTFVLVQIAGIRANGIGGYLSHLTGGTPPFLWIIMIPVEILGLFIKPFALTMRLFANMTAGHIVIVTLLGLIFVYKSYLIAPAAVAVTFAIYCLELFVAFMQAYIFTMLSSLFIGLAASHDH
jgi:F-type H+-transporting ATPase subunit a